MTFTIVFYVFAVFVSIFIAFPFGLSVMLLTDLSFAQAFAASSITIITFLAVVGFTFDRIQSSMTISRQTKSMVVSSLLAACAVVAVAFGWRATLSHQWVSREVMAGISAIAVIAVVFLVPGIVRGMIHFFDEAAKEID